MLEPGQSLAHYRIDRKIGQGGMGEVWAATDTRLNRPAAIKALPAAVAADPERLARFNREAQLLAALSHPNIAAIYGLEERDDAPYLALELVEGEDLSERITGRAVPVDEAIEIALQIAAALEEAHDKGIIHRDLKPANIKLTPDGKIKVLDFGLAKALSDDPATSGASLDWSRSPTMTAAMGTQAGVILGTAGYMSPEQARGKTVDRRADIWAFGVILFEMLTGDRLFHGETVTDVVAAVVTREPDWDTLPAATPPAVRRLLRRCLRKDPRRRLRDVGDAALELTESPGDDAAPAPGPAGSSLADAPPTSRRAVWLAGAAGLVLGLIGALAIGTALSPEVGPPRQTWSTLLPADGSSYDFERFLELSPDGRRVVYVATAPDGDEPLLWVRDLDNERPRPLVGTEGARQPFWSPDSRSIGYFAAGKLRRVGVDGGVSKTLADADNESRGAHWGVDDTILFVPGWSQPVYRVPAAGGTPEVITRFNAERLELSHRWPHMLPDGKHFLYFVVSTYPALNPDDPSEADKSGLYLSSLDGAEPRLLQTARSRAAYTDGKLLYVDDGVLMARPFDLETLSFTGEPVSIVEGVTQSVGALWGGALFSVSDEGTLLFVHGAPENRVESRMQWFDRDGNALGTVGETEPYNDIRISHDGRRVVSSIGDPGDIWIHDLARGGSTRFTFDPGNDMTAAWSPDDEHVMFQSSRLISGTTFVPGALFRKAASGLEQETHVDVVTDGPIRIPSDWAPDRVTILMTELSAGSGANILYFSLDDGVVKPFAATEHDEETPRLSSDGDWLAYDSNESGRSEIYVQPFSGAGGKWQVSRNGGELPVWRADGKELFYVGPDGFMAVSVETDRGFRHGEPERLFAFDGRVPGNGSYPYDVTPDGERFLVLVPVENEVDDPGTVTLLQNW